MRAVSRERCTGWGCISVAFADSNRALLPGTPGVHPNNRVNSDISKFCLTFLPVTLQPTKSFQKYSAERIEVDVWLGWSPWKSCPILPVFSGMTW